MTFELLTSANVEKYIQYLKAAISQEPDMMLIDHIHENAIRDRIDDPFYQSKKSILAIENSEVIGRISPIKNNRNTDKFRWDLMSHLFVF